MTLADFQSIVAKKHGLGTKLVSGHLIKYFNEASELYAQWCVNKALEQYGQYNNTSIEQ